MSELRWCKACDQSIPHDVWIEYNAGDGHWIPEDVMIETHGYFNMGFLGLLTAFAPKMTRLVCKCQRCDNKLYSQE